MLETDCGHSGAACKTLSDCLVTSYPCTSEDTEPDLGGETHAEKNGKLETTMVRESQ